MPTPPASSPAAFTEADHAAMRLAIEASRQARAAGDNPFGATLVSPAGQVLHTARNNQNTTCDCTGHAEMVLVREASAALGPQALRGASVFASGEPCAMCAGAMFWAGIARVVYAASKEDIAQALGGAQLATPCAELLAQARPPVAVEHGLLREEAAAALRGA